jgi:hypothetical protein
MTTQYYGAEIQDVQIVFEVLLYQKTGGQTGVSLVFNQKVLADTYTIKSTQPTNKPVSLSTTNLVLNYTPIILQLGRGGPGVGDPIALFKNFYPSYTFADGLKYDSKNLTKVQSIAGIKTSPAGDLIEVATTYSIIVSAPIIIITATEN